jgi:uncharacterized protein (DUF3084 family)
MDDPLMEEKFKLLFAQQIQKSDKQLQLLRDTMQALSIEVQSQRNQINDLRQQLASRPAVSQASAQETQKVLPASDKPKHPRQGDFKPGDVDIQKMFYFGHK